MSRLALRRNWMACVICMEMLVPAYGQSQEIPIIDAHSQFDGDTPIAQVLEYAARAGVARVILSARGRISTYDVLKLASKHPHCIIPSVRTKGRGYDTNDSKYYAMLSEQFREPAFRAMSVSSK